MTWERVGKVAAGLAALAFVVGGWAAALSTGVPQTVVDEVPAVARDLVFFHVATQLEGERLEVPAEVGEQYLGAIPWSPNYTWGIMTNSPWLSEQARLIVPFMAYEGIHAQGQYPRSIAFVPVPGPMAFHLGGAAGGGQIILNERYVLGDRDYRSLIATIVHELIHVQGGDFAFRTHRELPGIMRTTEPDSEERQQALQDLSVEIESHTSAATLEVLAAMCHYRREVACQAFWKRIRSLSSSSLEYRLGAFWTIYENTLWAGQERQAAFEKSRRFWAGTEERQETLEYIKEAYAVYPWEGKFLPGLCGDRLNTGNLVGFELSADSVREFYLGMNYDDSQALLGPLSLLCHLN